jgi:hypothetical protein
MGSNALEYKSLVKEGTKYISRLVVSYTHGAQQIFNKVQQRRAEIQRLRSQMQAEKKDTATAATVKAVVNLTEREDENGNHMNMKSMQIVDDRVNSRTANSVTIAAKKEARKLATEQVDRRVKGILKQCGITAELPVLPDDDPPSNSTYYPQPQAQPTSMITTQTTDETKNKRKRGSDRQRGSKNNRNGNKNYNRNANPNYNDNDNNNRNINDDYQDNVNNSNTSPGIAYDNDYDITSNNDGNATATHGDTEYNYSNNDDNDENNQAYEQKKVTATTIATIIATTTTTAIITTTIPVVAKVTVTAVITRQGTTTTTTTRQQVTETITIPAPTVLTETIIQTTTKTPGMATTIARPTDIITIITTTKTILDAPLTIITDTMETAPTHKAATGITTEINAYALMRTETRTLSQPLATETTLTTPITTAATIPTTIIIITKTTMATTHVG